MVDLVNHLSQESLVNYHLQSIFSKSCERATLTLFNQETQTSLSLTLRIEGLPSEQANITLEKLELEEDMGLSVTNPCLHDAVLIETMLFGVRLLLVFGSHLNADQITFRLLQEEAEHLLCFNKLFSDFENIYFKDTVITTFKMPITKGLGEYLITKQEKILKKVYHQLWSWQKENKEIQKYFKNKASTSSLKKPNKSSPMVSTNQKESNIIVFRPIRNNPTEPQVINVI
jgi:hypothetical protein